MSQFHYIAASKELDVGNFGANKTEIKEIEIIHPHLVRINGSMDIKFHFEVEKSAEELRNELEVYETPEDAAGIFISTLPIGFNEVRRHFENKYVYMVAANGGSLIDNEILKKNNVEIHNANLRCKKVLLEYIRERLKQEEFIEFFSSWAEEEGVERKKRLDRIIYFNKPESIAKLKIKDRQYIRFYLARKGS